MKSLPILAVTIVGLLGACSYRHEVVERPIPPNATVVATPAPAGTVVYSEPTPVPATTTVYTTR